LRALPLLAALHDVRPLRLGGHQTFF
jgi:hypothetical protein